MDHITTHYCSLQPGIGQSISRPQAEERSVAMDAVEGLTSLDELADDATYLGRLPSGPIAVGSAVTPDFRLVWLSIQTQC